MSAKELRVTIKGEDNWSFTKKYLIYDKLELDEEDQECKACLEDARKHLNLSYAVPAEEVIKTLLVLK